VRTRLKILTRPDASLDTALDRHLTARTCHQHALRRPAATSLVQERPGRAHIFRRVLNGAILHRSPVALLIALTVAVLVLAGRAEPAWAAGTDSVAWRLEQPKPPPPPPGVQGSSVPIGLGKIGDIEFWAPNRGLLITAGNPPTIPAGVWAYNGVEWHELSTVCGATDGRIAWAGPEEFWTISDGRPGQINSETGGVPPLEDNTLCRFSGGQVVASYAHPAFQVDSYQAMHAAGCITPTDCWFAGAPLPEPQIGGFQLHWNGATVEAAPYPNEGHAIEEMSPFEEHLYESVRVAPGDRVVENLSEIPAVHRINPEGVQPTFQPEVGLPLNGAAGPNSLDFLRLSSGGPTLWGAAGEGQDGGGQVTVVRRDEHRWSQLLGPATKPSGAEQFPHEAVSAIAAEPNGNSAWLGLVPPLETQQLSPNAAAVVARVSAAGTVSEAQTLSAGQLEGAVARIVCTAVDDCWAATTQGWLYHLAPEGEEQLPEDTDQAFAGIIAYRPPDRGLPQIPPDAPPVDDSGLGEEPPPYGSVLPEPPKKEGEARMAVPLVSHLHSRLVHGTTLELSFHLAVSARVRLIAKRHRAVVASTPMRTLKAGNCSLLLPLSPRRWPTRLDMQTHALAKLPTVPAGGSGGGGAGPNTVSTGLVTLPRAFTFAFTELGPLF
jgi:hypothetical protein